jgi:flagellar basal-body rod protein FlgG
MGMTTQMKKMDVVSNNLANVNTTGYKKDVAVTSTFDQELARRINDVRNQIWIPTVRNIGPITYGALVDEIFVDFQQGGLKTTDGTFDLALSGNGFFVVNTRAGERYTRDGSFTVDADGYLRTTDGGFVQGQGGNIHIPNGIVTIEKNGEITIGDEFIDRIRTIDFENYESLRKQSNNYYARTGETTERPVNTEIIQGALESSNVNVVREMVDLITINRNYESNQKIIQTIDSTLQRSAQDVGRK